MTIADKIWTEEEKFVWALVFALQRWKSYLMGRVIMVQSSCALLPHILRFPGDSPRVRRWIMIVQEFEVSFLKEETTRSKITDLLTYKENTETVKEMEVDIEPSNDVELGLEDVEGLLYFDGAFKPKTKVARIGYAFMSRECHELWSGSAHIEANSHNEAEYLSLIHALQIYLEKSIMKLVVKGDSLLVIRQLQGVWKVQKDSLCPLLRQVKQLQHQFIKCQFWHIPRDQNMRAHELASKVVSQVEVHAINVPLYKGCESLQEEKYVLKTRRARKELPYQKRVAAIHRAQRYVIIHDDLYLKDVDGVLKCVLWSDEIQECLFACHEDVEGILG